MNPLTAITGTLTIHPNNEKNSTPEVEYSEAAKKYINFRRQRLINARDSRDMPRPEFDDMSFLVWYDLMKKADDQYVAPRKNKQDTSINLGTIRDKDTTLVEYAQKFDFEPVAQVFDDDDDMMVEFAETGEDLVRKSLQLEDMKAKQKLIARAQVAFGVAMVEDMWVERWSIEKEFGKGASIGSLNDTWTEKKVKTYEGCQSKLWDLRKCYFGDIRKFFLNGPQGQPYFFTVEYESYDVTETYFGDWDRWVNVPTTVVWSPDVAAAVTYSASWTLRPVSPNFCEIIRYYDPIANEYAITINGVDMLPIMEKKTKVKGMDKTLISGFPLTEVSPSGLIPFSKFDLEPMHDFVYSKPQPAKMRILADIENMLMKMNIWALKQKIRPTMGNKSGRTFGEEVTDPATVINDIREGDLFSVLPNFQGPTTADFSMYELVKKELDKNSLQRSFQGIDPSAVDKTATQSMNEMKAQALCVSALFDGLTYGYEQLYVLRQYSIARHWTKPIDIQIDVFKKEIENKYRTVTVPKTSTNGESGVKKIIFTKNTPKRPFGKTSLSDSQDIHQQELDAAKNGQGEVSLVYLHPEIYRSMKLNWFWKSIPVPNDSDPLSYVLFAKQINDAILFFGAQSINVKKLKHRFANKTGQDYDSWFLGQQEIDAQQQSPQGAPVVTPGGPQNSPKSMPGQLPGAPMAPDTSTFMK
jgi:hypothetical protein